jgi:aspartyl-tRNA(Asn)/glutamyl-tRNA(Gln) amidotransferase subunit A
VHDVVFHERAEAPVDDYTNERRYHRRMQLPVTIAEASKLIAARELSPVELLRATLERILAWDGEVHAFNTVIAERAYAQARAAEREIARGGCRGPLHGIPFGAKDNYDTAGILTSGYSRAFLDNIPADDAAVIARLYAAGAILVGKLAMHELANGGPSFDLPWPPARNPWSLAHATGGSSTGAAAAVAAGFLPFALGTDTGGSIRIPAGMCGAVGLKPTYGLVSRAGVIPHSYTLDHCGPIAWTVEDCALVLQTIAGHDPRDRASACVGTVDYRAALSGDVRGLRIGVLRHWWEEPAAHSPDSSEGRRDAGRTEELTRAIDTALGELSNLGVRTETVRLQPLGRYYDVKNVIAKSEIFAAHRKRLIERSGLFGADFLALTLPGCLFSAADYLAAQAARRMLKAEMLDTLRRYDVLVTAGSGPAPVLAAAAASRAIDHWTRPNLETPFSVTGVPAMTLCIGFASGGLPLAMQIAARPFDEATVLRVGHAYERVSPWGSLRPKLERLPRSQPADRATESSGHSSESEPRQAGAAVDQCRNVVADLLQRSGIAVSDEHRALLYRLAPVAFAAARRVHGDRD